MPKIIHSSNFEDRRFKTISDFTWCVNNGGEIEFEFAERVFGVFSQLKRTPESPLQILICEKFVDDQEKTEKWCDTADEVLEYRIGDNCLRNVITKVVVWDRTI